MKQLIVFLILLVIPFTTDAQNQTIKYGYFSYREVLKSMPDYAVVQHNLETLRAKYDAEMKRVEEEFNKKYEEFIEGQKDFAPSILRKRQVELQELMAKNVAFKAETQKLLKQAEEEAFAPLKSKLAETLRGIGDARGFAFVLNTDNEAVPYINNAYGEDITSLIKESMQ